MIFISLVYCIVTDLENQTIPIFINCFFLPFFLFRERGETPSPVSSIQRLSQQDAEGYARLRSLQRHRRPSYSQSSLEVCKFRKFLHSF